MVEKRHRQIRQLKKKFIPTLCALVFILPVSSALAAAKRPNILFFFADDWGRYASVYADSDNPSLNDFLKTPHIDRIAREETFEELVVTEIRRRVQFVRQIPLWFLRAPSGISSAG